MKSVLRQRLNAGSSIERAYRERSISANNENKNSRNRFSRTTKGQNIAKEIEDKKNELIELEIRQRELDEQSRIRDSMHFKQ